MGKLVDRVTRKNQDLVSELPLTISAQYGLIDQNEFFDKRVASKDVSGYYLIENGEFAYNKSTSTDAPWGAVKRLDRYENGVLSTLYIVFGIKENNPVDSDFLVSYYSTNLWHKGIHEIAAEGARNHGLLNIAPADFFETELTMPQDIEEQKKIGKYFEELERLITLHQRKNIYFYEKVTLVWEQRKLGEIASSFEYGLNAAAKEYDGENKYIRITDIDDNTHEFLTYNLTSPDIDLTDVENYKLAEGDILFARTGASVGKSYIYRDSDGLVYYAGFLIRARVREEYDAEFVFQSTLTDKYNKYIAVTSQRSGQPGVNAQEYSEFEIRVPEKEEQTKIGTYFHNLDHLITLHQCKCHLLLKLLHNDWEQRKLGEVFKEYSEKGHTELPTLTIIQGGGTVKREDSDRNLMYDETNLSNYKMVRKDDFIVHLRSFEGGLEKASLDGIISPAYHTFHSDEADSRFYYPYFRSFEFIKHKLVPHVYGIRDGRSIDIEGMKSIEIPYTSLSEQRKIGDYLELLDHLITLHHRKYIYILKSP